VKQSGRDNGNAVPRISAVITSRCVVVESLLPMRRLAACLLLSLLCAGLTPPLLQAQGADVPACCRRNGKHHCAMLPQGDGFRTVAASCPYRGFTALTSHSTTLGTVATVLFISLHYENSATLDSPDLALPVCGNAQKRGPPLA
jgi:hypothetical protein